MSFASGDNCFTGFVCAVLIPGNQIRLAVHRPHLRTPHHPSRPPPQLLPLQCPPVPHLGPSTTYPQRRPTPSAVCLRQCCVPPTAIPVGRIAATCVREVGPADDIVRADVCVCDVQQSVHISGLLPPPLCIQLSTESNNDGGGGSTSCGTLCFSRSIYPLHRFSGGHGWDWQHWLRGSLHKGHGFTRATS